MRPAESNIGTDTVRRHAAKQSEQIIHTLEGMQCIIVIIWLTKRNRAVCTCSYKICKIRPNTRQKMLHMYLR